MVDENYENLESLLQEQIKATNRVNHAVRAIVIPSTIALIAFLTSLPFFLVAILGDFPEFLFLPAAILLIGFVIAIISQINESKLSEVPRKMGVVQVSSSEYCSCSDLVKLREGFDEVEVDGELFRFCKKCGREWEEELEPPN